MASVVALLSLLLLLGGCAPRMSSERWIFQKAGMTDAQRRQDQRECLTQAIDPTGPLRLGEFIRLDRAIYEACMAQRGYTLRIEH
jgi:hypothetical protein